MLKCNACGGTYMPTNTDGTQYFHRCPPLSAPELAAKVTAGKIALPNDPITGLPETADVAVTRRSYERPNYRDENVTKTGLMTKAGASVTVVADPTPAVVQVP